MKISQKETVLNQNILEIIQSICPQSNPAIQIIFS